MRIISDYTPSKIKKFILVLIIFTFCFSTRSQDFTINIHLRGVYESKISLLPLSGPNVLKTVLTVEGVKNGDTATLKFPEENFPGEFVLRFDYKENPASTPYPSEKRIIVNDQDLELWVHPVFCNNTDSTWFQEDERENTAFINFSRENARQKQMIGLLQNFLLGYDDPNSTFYTNGIAEYEKRRLASNQWINDQIRQYKTLFVSNMFGFQHIPAIDWKGSEADRKQSLRDNYFEGMDGYVNLYGELATTTALRDSLFTLAGKNAIEKAKNGDPLVSGWMVDYFFRGYESFNIQAGIKMLEPYLDDPDCLTTKRQEINRRLEGIKSRVKGSPAPDIVMQDSDNNPFILSSYQGGKNNILILFWSADCVHCKETTDKLYRWYQDPVA